MCCARSSLEVRLQPCRPHSARTGSSEWLDLLCTTSRERAGPKYKGPALTDGLVGIAAAYCGGPHSIHATEAMGLAWEVDPAHPGFARLADESTVAGAFVRAFLADKGLSAAGKLVQEAVM